MKEGIVWVPVCRKVLIDIHEAVAYFGLGRDLLHELTREDSGQYIVWINNKKYFKREKFEDYLEQLFSI